MIAGRISAGHFRSDLPAQRTHIRLRAGRLRSHEVKGGKQVTLTAGQTFYKDPDDTHVVGRNASSTKPAKLLVFLMKDKELRC